MYAQQEMTERTEHFPPFPPGSAGGYPPTPPQTCKSRLGDPFYLLLRALAPGFEPGPRTALTSAQQQGQ
jgi:hypothetical protein